MDEASTPAASQGEAHSGEAPIQVVTRATLGMLQSAGASVHLLFETVRRLPRMRPRWSATLDQMYAGGVLSIPIVALVGLFTGMVLTLQTGLELQKLGQQDLVGRIVAAAMCREMGPFVTGIILAAAVGSAMAAEVGTMAVSDELTALDVMTVDITRFLVLPRVLALAVVAPILTLFADLVGIIGGGLVAVSRLGVGYELYARTTMLQIQETTLLTVFPRDLYVGIAKSVVFGVTIAIIGCATGMRATNGARGVGEATRTAVRTSIMMIVVLNYVMTGLMFQ
jgi:phospholipid/cholesterol/gamma-HCH transport system permease protein